jgi:hypothetical protein
MTYTLIGVCYCAGESRAVEIAKERYQPKKLSDIASLFFSETGWKVVDEIYIIGDKTPQVIYKHKTGWKESL